MKLTYDEKEELINRLSYCRRCESVPYLLEAHTGNLPVLEFGKRPKPEILYYLECSFCGVKTDFYSYYAIDDMCNEWEHATHLYTPENHSVILDLNNLTMNRVAQKIQIKDGELLDDMEEW